VLTDNDIEYIDFGTYVNQDCDYNEYVTQAVRAMSENTCDFVLGFCRTGQGINMLANHLENTRAALVFDEYTAEYAIRHNCANFLTVPEKYVSGAMLDKMVKIWKQSSFDGGRHMTRMKKTVG
jgi:ribose 5-phosphate isomerase B